MHAQIRKVGRANGIKPRGNKYNLSDMIQESYKASYDAKKIGNKLLINLTESHLANIKKNPTDEKLSEDLDVLKDLVKLGKDQTLKDVEETEVPKKKRRKRSVESCVKPMTKFKESWNKSRTSMTSGLNSFRESAKDKVFYKELNKFNKSIAKKSPITMNEAVKLYKASNSCLTHLTVELERNPSFITSYKECTKLLSRDNHKLLQFIQEGKTPSRHLLESFVAFTNILLESETPDELDSEVYEDADLEELDDRDVLNEDADMEELDDRDVIDEDADLEELDDRDVLNEEDEISDYEDEEEISEDADMEELDDRDVLNEEDEVPGYENPGEPEDSVSVDLTPEEIDLLKKILNKISGMQESEELVADETPVPEVTGDEEDIDSPDVTPDIEEEIPDEDIIPTEDDEDITENDDDVEDEEFPDVEDEEDDPIGHLETARERFNEVIDELEDKLTQDDDEENPDQLSFELSESAMFRIKKCF